MRGKKCCWTGRLRRLPRNDAGTKGDAAGDEALLSPLYKKIGQLTVERDVFSQKVWAMNRAERLALVDHDDPVLTVAASARPLVKTRSRSLRPGDGGHPGPGRETGHHIASRLAPNKKGGASEPERAAKVLCVDD